MEFYILTIFPDLIRCYTEFGIVRQAIKKGKVKVEAVDIRKFAPKGQVDDTAYGGFPGMVLKPEPIFSAYESLLEKNRKPYVLITEPWGRRIDQRFVEELTQKERVAIICGRYEGVDERVKSIVDEEVSIGDVVLSGGELVALTLVDAVSRLLPGVLSEPMSIEEDSFRNRWIGYPVYTRPREFREMKVPEVLLSGNHRLIELWKLWHRIENTLRKRPDLIPEELTPEEEDILESIRRGMSFEEWLESKSLS
ncbi:tRNA (guanosine(37)-N1)-methyltransferase TrmD [Hydrogenivirga sp. 128-5-R1-1]|uniref:tRNA (guanosine(37)-N1)-methyltransferase TrmD n=1 Tax=Hydrogenivirga sp. 128-5-R1-1 TaxID=392423 RepID=UPI00015F169C|nr:tRNA (guanosine(37)-N1)-methyltransferase TrmD [Hydrogenivirga sp. 128-5-R1-1]EDP76219.1 tRNA guanine-N1 methyltransferase [Hydrogenivirga sp. 128-5-R1-1]